MPRNDKKKCEVPAARMTVELVELLGRESRAMTLSEIALGLEANRPMVLRLLRVLEGQGWVRRIGAKGPYRLTPRPLHFICRAVGTENLVAMVTPTLKKVAQKTNCIAVVSVPDRESAVCLAYVSQNEAVGVSTRVGCRYSYHATSPGKTLLAFSDDAPLEEILDGPLEKFTPNTLTTRPELERELAAIRRQGYAGDNEESFRGIVCLNVPLFDYRSVCVATLGISTLAYYHGFSDFIAKYREIVCSAGEKLSVELGYIRKEGKE